MESLDDRIKVKLEQIANCICKRATEPLPDNIGGLYGGEWGNLLFICYYAKYSKNSKIIELTETYSNRLLSHNSLENLSHTFSDGFSGILYLLNFLKKQKLLFVDIDEVEATLENYINRLMMFNINVGNYDFLHGALGVGYYFLKKGRDQKLLSELVDSLYNTAEKDFFLKCFKWKSRLNDKKDKGYNIGFAHGMASKVLFLSKLIKNNLKNDKLFDLLENSINYILSQEIDSKNYGCYFPPQSLENKEQNPILKSRLAWCYGDLGIAYSIWFAGIVASKKEWINKGYNILLDSTKRKDLTSNLVIDASICHGTSGIAMFFRRMYLLTSNPLFLDSSNYWFQQSFNMASFSDGLAGYMTYKIEWVCDYSLLMGISGIGMLFISYLLHDQQPWDELFLL